MKVTGFTFIRNAEKFDYPIIESIESILPLCTQMIVAVGNSSDNTRAKISNINSDKIIILDTIWNDNLREGGKVLAEETDKAYNAISNDTDWCFYIQGDEVIHEKYYNEILGKMNLYKDDKNIDGLLFKYKHFYGSYDYIAQATKWYKNEIRILRKNNTIFSYKDAQGFRKKPNEKLCVKPIDAYIYHYGWVKNPYKMNEKVKNLHKYWHSDEWIENQMKNSEHFDFKDEVDALQRFTETHPLVMQNRIQQKNWTFDYDITFNKLPIKDKIKIYLSENFGISIGEYKNYKIV